MTSAAKLGIEDVGRLIIDSGLRVHRKLGPGLMESTYQTCLANELGRKDLVVEREIVLPVLYDGFLIQSGYRIDMLIEDSVVIENKAVQQILPVHEAQLLTYLRLSDKKLGFLINWNVCLFKDGIKRMVNNL